MILPSYIQYTKKFTWFLLKCSPFVLLAWQWPFFFIYNQLLTLFKMIITKWHTVHVSVIFNYRYLLSYYPWSHDFYEDFISNDSKRCCWTIGNDDKSSLEWNAKMVKRLSIQWTLTSLFKTFIKYGLHDIFGYFLIWY